MISRLLSLLILSVLIVTCALSLSSCRTAAGKRGGDAKSGGGPAAGESGAGAEEGNRKLESRVRRIIADELGVQEEEVGMDSSFVEDLDADDLDKVSLIMRFEEEFNVSIPDEDAEKIKTVREACVYIRQHRQK